MTDTETPGDRLIVIRPLYNPRTETTRYALAVWQGAPPQVEVVYAPDYPVSLITYLMTQGFRVIHRPTEEDRHELP